MTYMKILEGKFEGKNLKIAIVVARFNQFITSSLLNGAVDGLVRHGVSESDIEVVWVPGSFEIPLTAKRISEKKEVDGMICLGAIIRGQTAHFDYVASQTASGIMSVTLTTHIPIIFGVLTTETIEQAVERAGTKSGNKGFDSALTMIEQINLLKQI